MKWIEYILTKLYVSFCFYACCLLPIDGSKVVFASPRSEHLTGNLLFLYQDMRERMPKLNYVFLLERYGYSLGAKIKYALGLARGAYHLATARIFLVDNAYFPVHVVHHRKKTQVVQLWHAVGAMKKFGADAPDPTRKQENRFVHRNYDWVIVGSDFAVTPYASAFRMPGSRVLPLGCPRTDFLFDQTAMTEAGERIYSRYPELKDGRIMLYAPTYRGQGVEKRQGVLLNPAELRARVGPGWKLVYKPHPTTPMSECAGFDVVADDAWDINEWFAITDVLVTDYSSSAIEYAVLNKPMILLVPDLADYERSPGFYFDFHRDMVGSLAKNTAQVADHLLSQAWDMGGYPAFIARHFTHIDGGSTRRVTDFLSTWIKKERI